MDTYQPKRSFDATSSPSSAPDHNPNWRPWMYQPVITSEPDQYHVYRESPPKYTLDNNSFRNHTQNQSASPVLPTASSPEQRGMQQPDNLPAKNKQARAFKHFSPQLSCEKISSPLAPTSEGNLYQALGFALPSSLSRSHQIQILYQPIAIPQIRPGIVQSFLRAYPPSLLAQDITESLFLAFIDNLNIVSTANPPLQMANLAGSIIGMVPHHWAQIAGTAIQATAKLGTAAVSKGRTEIYMRAANEKLFAPRGLKVSIVKYDAVRTLLRIPDTEPSLAPLQHVTSEDCSLVDRVMTVVGRYDAELRTDVQPVADQTTLLAKLSARQVVKEAEKNQEKAMKHREKVLAKEEKRERKLAGKSEKKKVKKDRGTNKENDKLSKEEKQVEKLMWIIIENL